MGNIYGLILFSGSGERCKKDIPKQFIKIGKKTIIEHTIEVFEENKYIDEIILVCNPLFRNLMEEILSNNKYKKIIALLDGGKTRRESSYIGTDFIKDEGSSVLIHDGVRPFLSQRIIEDCIKALETYDAVAAGVPCVDTIIKVNDEHFIEDIPQRKYLMRIQTPQGFKTGLIKKAHSLALNDMVEFTDDCGLVVKYKLAPVYVVPGEEKNIKITYKEDLIFAKKIFD
jgi:2-C-methyl-D-erythritol 4-phosphate cytidylyltransferase